MIVEGVMKYFKSLAVGGGIESTVKGLFTGQPKKCTLIYAQDTLSQANNILEIDSTVDFDISMETKLLDTPAEDQIVYTSGALRQPKTIIIRCYLELDKLVQLNQIHRETIPVYVVYEKPMPSVITQKGYYADADIYALQTIKIQDEGFKNCVACTLILREIQTFTYQSEYLYNTKQNTVGRKATNKRQNVGTVSSLGFGNLKNVFTNGKETTAILDFNASGGKTK